MFGDGGVQGEETAAANAERQELSAESYKSLRIHSRSAWRVSQIAPALSSCYMGVLLQLLIKH